MSNLKVAVIQCAPKAVVEENLHNASVLLARAAEEGAELVVLPEMFGGVAPPDRWRGAAEPTEGPTEQFLSRKAADHGFYVVGGSYIEDAGNDAYFNTCPVFAPDGTLVGRYRKMHLFWTDIPGRTAYDERSILSPGGRRFFFEAEGFRVAVGICYDLRFPEFFRPAGGVPVDLYCLGAAFMQATGEAHWEVLVRARAVENLAFFAAAGTVGSHYELPDRPGEAVATYGHSMVVSPWGAVLAEVEAGEGVAAAKITRQAIDEARARLGALDHIRGDLWPNLR